MLELGRKLPQGALIGGEEAALVAALAPTGGLRFVAREADLLREAGRITGWRATGGEGLARASGPNTGNSELDGTASGGLVFREAVNCGFVLPAFSGRSDLFTAAVIYASAGEARTLVSVTPGQSMNQVFLSESRGKWVALDRSGTTSLARPRPPGPGTQLAILSCSGTMLSLRAGGQTVSAAVSLPKLDVPGDFFIGCRSNRPGLAKTQGTMILHEVLFWPDRALLASARPEDAEVLAALDRYARWTW
jgi:hypothetical protein